MTKKAILWIENELEYYESIIEYLRELNYEVNKASSAEEGLLELRNKPKKYDLIIMDILMGYTELEGIKIENGRTGFALYEIIRNKLQLEIPIMVYTVLFEKEDMQFLKNVDNNRYNFSFVHKPIDPIDFVIEVRKCIGDSV